MITTKEIIMIERTIKEEELLKILGINTKKEKLFLIDNLNNTNEITIKTRLKEHEKKPTK